MITTFIRKYLMNAYTTIPMLLCLMFTTWNSYGKHAANSTNFSGEEMFRGLFFIEGRYAEAIPELKSMCISYMLEGMSPEDKKQADNLRNKVVRLIKNDNPEFFNHFKDVILTEDPILIKEELAKTHDIINEKIQEVLQINESELLLIKQKFSQSVKDNNNKVDKKLLKCFEKNLAIKSLEQQPCIILLMPVCIVLLCAVVVYTPLVIVQESVASKKSALLTEQIVASVCEISIQMNS